MKPLYILLGALVVLFICLQYKSGGGCGCGKNKCQCKDTKKTSIVTLYHSHGCGHCVKLMPEWLDYKRKAIDKKMGVKLVEVEASEGNVPSDIQGFPTCEYQKKYYVGAIEIRKLLTELINEKPNSLPQSKSQNTYTLYYAEWCGYSKKILPEWEKVASRKSNFKKVEEKDLSEKLSGEIDGFPIMYINDGTEKVMGYDRISEFLTNL